ncbi:sel1 repeat family protein [Francisella sp. Scap27]|uniref:tetratricopeptide repeat protein n=1 Tax=Francisella sp. Scap27 TaxID=2589986 RepID=UPI0015BA10BD|nr:SEL1-like repeat protein [Francisella sp. Scap27]QLE78945.1 sel1 repeat family protein [Francisella sp. Scap27]
MRVKILFALLGVLFYNSSFATLEQCYKDGADEEYEKVLDTCKPYQKKDARATGLIAEANVQLDEDDKLALDDAEWAVDFYKKNGTPNTVEGMKAYVYLIYLIGELYYFGSDDIPVDQDKGYLYIREAAHLGYDIAQNQLANLYVRVGDVPATNFAKAYRWYKLAIANGSLDARKAFILNNEEKFIGEYPYCISQGRTYIGDAYFEGFGGLRKNHDKALEWYTKAYEVDHISPVEVGLAKVYLERGDMEKAMMYTKEAITQPYAPAFVEMYELEKNDKVKQYAYLSVAISLFERPDIKYWEQFNEYCLPDLSEKGINYAKKNIKQIELTNEEKVKGNELTRQIIDQWHRPQTNKK